MNRRIRSRWFAMLLILMLTIPMGVMGAATVSFATSDGANLDGGNNVQLVDSQFGNDNDTDGYDTDGYDADGYDADGYDRDGYDRDGYDREGYDREGYDRDGYDREGNDRNGDDRDNHSHKVAILTVTPETAAVFQGGTKLLTAVLSFEEPEVSATTSQRHDHEYDIVWSSVDPKVSVDQEGLVTVASDALIGDYIVTATATENDDDDDNYGDPEIACDEESSVSDTAVITVIAFPLYSVTYNANGGTGAVVDSNEYLTDAVVTVKDQGNLLYTGFEFLGWKTDIDSTEMLEGYIDHSKIYLANDQFKMGESNIEFFAQWKAIPDLPPAEDPDPIPTPDPEPVVTTPSTPVSPPSDSSPSNRRNRPDPPTAITTIAPEATPQAAPIIPEVVPEPVPAPIEIAEVVVPLGVAVLPKTGEIPASLFYGLGGMVTALGAFLKRK